MKSKTQSFKEEISSQLFPEYGQQPWRKYVGYFAAVDSKAKFVYKLNNDFCRVFKQRKMPTKWYYKLNNCSLEDGTTFKVTQREILNKEYD